MISLSNFLLRYLTSLFLFYVLLDDCGFQIGLNFANLKCQVVGMYNMKPKLQFARRICKVEAALERLVFN